MPIKVINAETIKIREIIVRQNSSNINELLKLHGLLLTQDEKLKGCNVLVPIENEDGILDFNQLFVRNFEDDKTFDYDWIQQRSINTRTKNLIQLSDPILKACHIFTKDPDSNESVKNYSAIIRLSGKVDLYWNMYKLESSKQGKLILKGKYIFQSMHQMLK